MFHRNCLLINPSQILRSPTSDLLIRYLLFFTLLYLSPTPLLAADSLVVESSQSSSQPSYLDVIQKSNIPITQLPKIISDKFSSGRLAFTYILNNHRDIYVADFFTNKVTPIIASSAADEYPSWSPNGTKLAFHSNMTQDREIYVINSDGSNLIQLTNSPGIDEDPNWSPNGDKITFHSERVRKGVFNIFVMNADGTNPNPLTNNSYNSKSTVPKWSPRGDEIVYSTNRYWPGWDLMLYSFANNKSSLLTSGLNSFCRASWHPNGGLFAFSYGSGTHIDLWLQKKGKTVATQLTDIAGREYDSTWHESGEGLFFVSETSKGSGNFDAFYIEIETKQITPLISAPGVIRNLSWTSLPFLPSQPKKPNNELTETLPVN